MNSQTQTYHVGIDVSKEKLDVFHPAWERPRCFANTPRAIRDLLAAVAAAGGPCQLTAEATGGYEKQLVQAAAKAEVPISIVNPRQVRDYARAAGVLAKTDEIDARTLADYGRLFEPTPTEPLTASQQTLRAAVRRRESLIGQRTREKDQLGKDHDALVRRDLKSSIAALDRRIAKWDAHIATLIASDSEMAAKKDRLEQIKGVGAVASSTLLAEFPELGRLGDRQAAALAGLAPYNCDSGRWHGLRSIRGGRGRIRRALYMPALCAVRHNPVLREFYQRLRAKNKPHKVALTAAMRKMVCVLNRMLADPHFQPAS